MEPSIDPLQGCIITSPISKGSHRVLITPDGSAIYSPDVYAHFLKRHQRRAEQRIAELRRGIFANCDSGGCRAERGEQSPESKQPKMRGNRCESAVPVGETSGVGVVVEQEVIGNGRVQKRGRHKRKRADVEGEVKRQIRQVQTEPESWNEIHPSLAHTHRRCPVCLEEYDGAKCEMVSLLQCGHTICTPCLMKDRIIGSSKTIDTCCICKRKVAAKTRNGDAKTKHYACATNHPFAVVLNC